MKPHIKYRLGKSKFFKAIVILLSTLCTVPLFLILFYILREGITRINWHFLVNLPKPVGEAGGGIANALVGSLLIVFFAALMAIPVGVMGGIYLSENKKSRLANLTRLAVDVLQGTPSIVVGIVIYFWIVKPLSTFSALSGSVALAIMMLPIVVRSTEETLKLLPASLKEAGLALGLPYQRVILRIVLPCGFSGVISGIILAVARIAGETAPLLFTAFGNPFFSTNIFKPMQSLPLLIFNYATSPYDEWHDLAWGAALILLLWVLLLNIITKITTRRWKIQF
ncbi:phosphate ABC transporter permease PstA [Ginsengibacter hankyongi]|uniref:Phosphate transport system permease protein PstA n=1 Tax=Ginsengibacter hankyongi TaxID=2607284 RepID=A0A5J5IH17_9BACT|nr:phosphate ABC transporter permease PstA [Ginsengibacter hankyongi]KAA9039465.1 phosphate ABC transporter permease PstA [Ginsengibacter hankyongi]